MLWWTIRQLKSSQWQVRAETAARLGAAREKKAVPALIHATADENSQVRIAAINALAELRHPAAAEPLAARLAELASLSKAPARGDGEEAPTLAEYEALARALGAQGAACVPTLLRLLDAQDRDTRRWAAHALGLAHDARAIDPLVRRLADNRSEVRKAAAQALGALGDAHALDPLIQCLTNRDQETRRAAVLALGDLGDERAVDALRSTCGDPNESIQLASVESLRKIGGLRAGAALNAMLDSGRKAVRDAAAAALRSLEFSPGSSAERAAVAVLKGDFPGAAAEGEAAIPFLAEVLSAKDPNRRRLAVDALGLLRSPSAVPPLVRAVCDHDAMVQQAAAQALRGGGPEAIQGLASLLSHADPSVQSLAARALGEGGRPQAVDGLSRLIEQNPVISNEFPEVADALRAAADSLMSILAASSAEIPQADLERLASVPDAVRQRPRAETQAPEVDCAPIRALAQTELKRRGFSDNR